MASKKVSTTSTSADAPIVLYSNSPEATDLNSNYSKIIPGNVIGPVFLSSGSLDSEDLGFYPPEINIGDPNKDSSDENSNLGSTGKKFPQLSDVTILSNAIQYDPAGNPTAKIIFKIKNSSGEDVKSVNVLVSIP